MGGLCGKLHESNDDDFDRIVREYFGMSKDQLEKKLLEEQEIANKIDEDELIIPESDYPDSDLEKDTGNSQIDSVNKEFRDPKKFESYVKDNYPELYDQIKSVETK